MPKAKSKAQHQGYLAAMIDGEGTVTLPPAQSGNSNRTVRICSTEKDIIEAVAESCEALDIGYRVTFSEYQGEYSHWSPRYDLVISTRPELEKVAKLPLASTRKRERLDLLLASYQRKPRPPREDLELLYWEEGWRLIDIAKKYRVASNTVKYWFNCYEIPRRSRGTHYAQSG